MDNRKAAVIVLAILGVGSAATYAIGQYVEQAIAEAYDDGHQEGHAAGVSEGFSDGHTAGYNLGYDEGRTARDSRDPVLDEGKPSFVDGFIAGTGAMAKCLYRLSPTTPVESALPTCAVQLASEAKTDPNIYWQLMGMPGRITVVD